MNKYTTTLICINDKPFPINEIGPTLSLDKIYSLKDVFTCKCGENHFDVGLENDVNYVECYKCRETLPSDIRWCHSSRFKENG